MYKLESDEMFHIKDYEVYIVKSPVTAKRTKDAMLEALGTIIEINGKEYTPIGVEMHMPVSPVRIGEVICIAVKDL